MNAAYARSRWLRLAAGVLALAATAGAPSALAQRWQNVHGMPTVVETGFHGTKQCVGGGGGYIAVGESFCCGAVHAAYVVRVNPAGVVIWSNVYKFGNSDRATDVIELASGDFVVCGTSIGPGGCTPSNDIFIMKINAGGALLTANTYGAPSDNEEAWKIVEAQVGDGITTFAGDYIVAGSTGKGQTAPNRDGYILRVNSTLGLIWDAQYGGAAGNTDDYFYGVDEVPPTIGGAGDIVATGGTNTWGAGALDVFTVRVNGNTGAIGLAPQGASASGTANNDEGQSILVQRAGPNTGNLVIIGYTNSPAAPSVSDEVLLFELNANPCIQVSDLAFGDFGTKPDRGFDLKADANPAPAGANQVIVTGYTFLGGLGGRNAFLQRVNGGCGQALAGGGMAYGGNGNDEGHSLDNAIVNNPGGAQTLGYIVNGMTQSPNLIAPDPEQLYLLKTDVLLSSGCNEAPFTFASASGFLTTTCVTPTISSIGAQCTPPNSVGTFPPNAQLCYAFPRARQRGNNGNDGGGADADAPPVINFNDHQESVTSYPNPLRAGSALGLRFNVTTAKVAHVAVSDIVGRIIYEGDVDVVGGNTLHTVSTRGWAAGSYIVHVTGGDMSYTTRIVIGEK